jgi:hypothetical protein
MSVQVVHVRVNDAATGQPTPVRIRFTTPDGRYLPPLGRLADFPTGANENVGGSVMLGDKRYAYIDGSCEIRLPEGPIAVEVSKGPEYDSIQQTWERKSGQISLRLSIARKCNLQQEGWYAGDTQVFLLSPQAAWLEGAAEGLPFVNVLAAEWSMPGHLFHSNLLEFSGQQPALVKDDCQVIVNTQNRSESLGSLSLLNCHRIVYPLSLSWEGFEQWTLHDWCDQCHRKGGLVIWPAFPGEPGERLADLLLGAIDAVEWTAGGDFETAGLEAWYRLLNCGCRVPLVGGSGKASNAVCIGAVRTYAQLEPGQPPSYGAWIEAIRAGRTFVTRGPLLRLAVNVKECTVMAEATSVLPFERLELVEDGAIVAEAAARSDFTASLSIDKWGNHSTWLAARCWSGDGLAAHTAPFYLQPQESPVEPSVAQSLLDQLKGMAAWAQTQIQHAHQREHLLASFSKARSLLAKRLSESPLS